VTAIGIQSEGIVVSNKKILIADDDQQVLRLMAMVLKGQGHDVVTAVDGYQALQFTLEQRPNLLILDVNMPAGDGLSVQQRIQNNAVICMTPVIYVTGDRSPRVASSIKRLGGIGILHKPFSSAELLEIVKNALSENAMVKSPA
jgi:DNA-binding response OmpR family regulator